jgi:hypothetical protein
MRSGRSASLADPRSVRWRRVARLAGGQRSANHFVKQPADMRRSTVNRSRHQHPDVFPRYYGDARPAESDTEEALPEGEKVETIRVVEDHADLRAYVSDLLRDLNYRVFAVSSAQAALTILMQDAPKVDSSADGCRHAWNQRRATSSWTVHRNRFLRCGFSDENSAGDWTCHCRSCWKTPSISPGFIWTGRENSARETARVLDTIDLMIRRETGCSWRTGNHEVPGSQTQRDPDPGAGLERENIMEIVYFIGALILLTALIYGTLNHQHRDRRRSRVANQIVRDRYEHNRT